MLIFYIVSSLIFFVWILSFVKGLRELNRNTHLTPVRESAAYPFISIVIPARNEEKRIVYLLESVSKQNYKNLEVIVVDDNSEDATVSVAESFRDRIKNLKVVKAAFKEGWCGKNSALVSGFNETSDESEWVLFIDADCELKENALIGIADFVYKNSLDCLSLFPEVKSSKFFERLLLPSVGAMVTLFNSPEKVNNPSAEEAFLNGQFIFIKKGVYRDVGTHEIVRDAVLEDAALAAEIKRKGLRMFLGFGENIFLIRMYETFGEFVSGWTKNLYLILGKKVSNLIKMILITVLLSFFPVIWAVYGIYIYPDVLSLVFIAGYLTVLTFQMYLRYKSRTYPFYAFLAPVSSVIISYIALKSAYKYIYSKGVDWKGRKYFSDR
ncbi:MAG: glycosyltransferase family 2 protein [Deltaproteobacteria bacterium]|nr:glycosyltransferase family 2 protein [Deltaproteobacteria bacterium]